MTNIVIIEPGRKALSYWADVWSYRELFQVLAWRDIAVRYKQTVIGVLWAVIRPFLTMLVFTVVFGRLAKLPSEGNAPYALLVFAGMLPWSFFSTALAEASFSLVMNANMISKIYFPRMIVPISSVVVAFVDFLVSFAMLLAMMVWFHYSPTWRIIFLPAFVVLAFFASIGPVLWIAALNVRYRDFRYLIPFMVQFGLYVSPVGFSSNVVPERWRLLYSVNPMVGVIDGFRWCLLDKINLYWPGLVMSVMITCLLTWWGARQFRNLEKSFADTI
jgi:lipopolysaccharide transport system permease protein